MNLKVASPQQPYVSRDKVGNLSSTFSVATQGEKDTLLFAIDAYGYIIKRNERVSFADFAERIAKVFDATEPHNAAVITALRAAPNVVFKETAVPA
jgi:hypothetical protein